MSRLIFTGASGFIGSYLFHSFSSIDCVSLDLRKSTHFEFLPSDILLHCANSLKHHENMSMLRKLASFFEFGAPCKAIFFQSFATLTGKVGDHDLNHGFKPSVLDDYAQSKLKQEIYIRKNFRHFVTKHAFIYLPAVIGPGGSWSRVINQISQSQNFSAPKSTNFNHCTLPDLREAVSSVIDFSGDFSVMRVICNSTISASKSFASFCDDVCDIKFSEFRLSYGHFLIFYLFFSGVFSRSLWKLLRFVRGMLQSEESQMARKDFSFGPFYVFLLSQQIYIPPAVVIEGAK